MPRNLYLLRHAQSADKQHGQTDKERVLTHLGMKQSLLIAQFLKEQNSIPEVIFCSVAERARETARLIADNLNFEQERLLFEEELYEASTRTFLEFINQIDDQLETVMCVSHNPTISYLSEFLTKSEIGEIAPGGMVILRFNTNSWKEVSEGSAQLVGHDLNF
jgi:phosphohistidine phosphatase